MNLISFRKDRQDSYFERGGILFGRWNNSKPVVTKIHQITSTSLSQRRFRFQIDKELPINCIGFWHTHTSKLNHSLFDLFAYWQLKRFFCKDFLFLLFVQRNIKINALRWSMTDFFPSPLSKIDVSLPSDWYNTVFIFDLTPIFGPVFKLVSKPKKLKNSL